MIYTIGYDHMRGDSGALGSVMTRLKIDALIDVRSIPYSKIPAFRKEALEHTFGNRYEWWGDCLGGRGVGPTVAGLNALVKRQPDERLLLMCKEQAPGDCHRHFTIAVPLLRSRGIDCTHIYENQLILASELHASIGAQRDYQYTEF